MDHPLIDLINQKIREAEEAGDFDNLEGAGKPLPKEDDPENALLNRLVKESGGVPEFVSLSRELAELREELRETGDRMRRQEIMKKMSMMDARIDMLRQLRALTEALPQSVPSYTDSEMAVAHAPSFFA